MTENIAQAAAADAAHAETVIGAEAAKIETAVTTEAKTVETAVSTDAKAVAADVEKEGFFAHLRSLGVKAEADLDFIWQHVKALAEKL